MPRGKNRGHVMQNSMFDVVVVVFFPHLSTLQMNQSNDYFAREYEIINEKKNEEENGFFACPFYIQSISHDDKLKIITIDTCLPS